MTYNIIYNVQYSCCSWYSTYLDIHLNVDCIYCRLNKFLLIKNPLCNKISDYRIANSLHSDLKNEVF